MRYKVTIHQELKYGETIVGYFDCREKEVERMYEFIDCVVSHFKNAEAAIEMVPEEDNDENHA